MSRIDIQRFPKQINVTIVTAKPGIVIGRRGANINALKTRLEQMSDIKGKHLRVDVVEVENPEIDARVVAEGIAEQLERRVRTQARHAAGRAAHDAQRSAGHQGRCARPSVRR